MNKKTVTIMKIVNAMLSLSSQGQIGRDSQDTDPDKSEVQKGAQ